MLLILWVQAVLLGIVLSTTGVIPHEKAQTQPQCIKSQVQEGDQDSQTQPGLPDAGRHSFVDAVLQPGQCVEN